MKILQIPKILKILVKILKIIVIYSSLFFYLFLKVDLIKNCKKTVQSCAHFFYANNAQCITALHPHDFRTLLARKYTVQKIKPCSADFQINTITPVQKYNRTLFFHFFAESPFTFCQSSLESLNSLESFNTP